MGKKVVVVETSDDEEANLFEAQETDRDGDEFGDLDFDVVADGSKCAPSTGVLHFP